MSAEPIHLSNATPFDLISEHLEDLVAEARNFADGEPVTTEGQDKAVADLIDALNTAAKDADAERVRENEPHDKAKAAVQAKYAPLIADRKNKNPGKVWGAIDALKACRKPYLDALEAKKREAERLAREAAETAAREAREALAAAAASDMAARDEAEAKVRAAEDAQRVAKVAANDKVKGIRTKQVAIIIDLDAAVRFYWGDNRDAFAELVQKLADADARSSRRVAKGVEFREERVL